MRSSGTHSQQPLAVLDIGTSKVACMIAQADEYSGMRIIGMGHQLSSGIKSGVITDIREAETSIVAAVHAAEQMAGLTIEDVVVSVNGTPLRSRNVAVEMDILSGGVGDSDIADILAEGTEAMHTEDCDVIHCFPSFYSLDENRNIRDPRGMLGDKLSAELQIITAKHAYLRNLSQCIARAHLNVKEFVSAAHASALSVCAPDELDLGVTVIDIGGGVTTLSVFVGGRNIYSDAIGIGGHHVTSDIAQGLSTSLAHAERLKTLYGSAITSVKDAEMMIDVPQLGEYEDDDEPTTMPRAMLVGVIRPRMEEIFELLRHRLASSGVGNAAGRRCVITGGASQLIGASDLAAKMLNKQVRKGRPMPYPGIADAVSGPAFAGVVGLLHYMQKRPWEDRLLEQVEAQHGFYPKKLVAWARQFF
jgi:cell division protein FtsA